MVNHTKLTQQALICVVLHFFIFSTFCDCLLISPITTNQSITYTMESWSLLFGVRSHNIAREQYFSLSQYFSPSTSYHDFQNRKSFLYQGCQKWRIFPIFGEIQVVWGNGGNFFKLVKTWGNSTYGLLFRQTCYILALNCIK